jgi:hypothetical protein
MGVDIKGKNVCSLCSADDQVIVAQDDDDDMPRNVLGRMHQVSIRS